MAGRHPSKPIEETQGYERSRRELGLSRADVVSYAKRAGINLSAGALQKLEETGERPRSLSEDGQAWLDYLYGNREADVDWAGVEKGSPVLVLGEKGSFSFQKAENGTVSVFGGERNKEKFRSFEASKVRLVSGSAVPSEDQASLYESRGRGSSSVYGEKILGHMRSNGGAHGVGALAYSLGLDSAVVSRVTSALAKSGKIKKVGRGTYTLTSGTEEAVIDTNAAVQEQMASGEMTGKTLDGQDFDF